MKRTRLLLSVLLAVLLLAVSVAPAMAASPYAVKKPSITGEGLGLKEKLEVTEEGSFNPAVTYTLTLGNIQVYNSMGDTTKVKNVNNVNGKTLGTVSYEAQEVRYGSSVEKNYEVPDAIVNAINALEFDRPGIYYWEITKTKNSTDNLLSNHNRSQASPHGTALVIRVDDVNGVLTPTVSINVFNEAAKTTLGNKDTEYMDHYPAKPGTLTLKKAVTGNQGQKDRYFKFVVELAISTEFNGSKLTPTGSNSVKTATAKYGEAITGADNTAEVTIANGKATFTFWLNDQEEVTIPNIPGIGTTTYTITESENEGYTVTYSIEANSVETEGNGNTISARQIDATTGDRVVFKNDKASTTPTGINLQLAAPVFGIVLVGVLLAVLLMSKRRENV